MRRRLTLFYGLALLLGAGLACVGVFAVRGWAGRKESARQVEIERVLTGAAFSGSSSYIAPGEVARVIERADAGDEAAVLRLFGAVSCPAPNADGRIQEALERALRRGSVNALKWRDWRAVSGECR